MEHKQTGFSLFPQPPTPPARRSRNKTRSLSSGSSKLLKSRSGRSHAREASSICEVESIPPSPGLIPAPLRVRKSNEDVPSLPPLPPSTPSRSQKKLATIPKTPEQAPLQPHLRLPQTPTRKHEVATPIKPKGRAVSDNIELETQTRRRASTRLSQWLDLEDGEIDRRRLSMYLGSVLDNTFEVPVFESVPVPPIPAAHHRRVSVSEWRPLTARCKCSPGTIICHCSSSPEFEHFKSWSSHKSNSSISSTTCLLGVPRARFQSAFYHIPEPQMAELSSPPGLSYDSEEEASEMGEWASPRTPSKDDVFSSPSTRSYSSKCVVSTSLSASPSASMSLSTRQSRLQSFSRPFRPDSTHRCLLSEGLSSPPSSPSTTPSRSHRRNQSKSTSTKFLKSISTMSSFEFDFDRHAAAQAMSVLQTSPANPSMGTTLPIIVDNADEKENSNHTRTESNESFGSSASQPEYELSTATAAVARTTSTVKPVLVTNSAKRIKTPSSSLSSTSTKPHSASLSTSSSFSSSLQSWRTANEALSQTPTSSRSRPQTAATKMSTATGELEALLHMPLFFPTSSGSKRKELDTNGLNKKSSRNVNNDGINNPETFEFYFDDSSKKNSVPGNAFHRSRSNPLSSYNTGSGQDEGQKKDVASYALSARANTSAGFSSKKPTNNVISDESSPLNLTSVRSGIGATTEDNQQPLQQTQFATLSRPASRYLYIDDRATNREDSGVFGLGNNNNTSSTTWPLPILELDSVAAIDLGPDANPISDHIGNANFNSNTLNNRSHASYCHTPGYNYKPALGPFNNIGPRAASFASPSPSSRKSSLNVAKNKFMSKTRINSSLRSHRTPAATLNIDTTSKNVTYNNGHGSVDGNLDVEIAELDDPSLSPASFYQRVSFSAR